MGVRRKLAVVLLGAGSVLLASGVASAETDPEVEQEGRGSTSSAVPTTLASTTTLAGTTTTTVEAPAVSTSTTTTALAPAAIEQVPTFWLRGLCATPSAFIFAMSNLGTQPVDVALVFNGAPFETVTLAPGEVYGFRTDVPGTMVADLPGASFQTESFDAPCPIAPGSIGIGGLCRDATAGYQWLIGNSGPDPVDVEVRLEGSVVGTFTVVPGGFAGFTTPNGGDAEALVGGQVVAEASSSESPCVRGPVSFFATCFAPGQGYGWFISNDTETALVLELRVGGSPQAVLTLAPFEGRDLTTTVGGLGELLENGEVIASAASSSVLCDSMIALFSICSDAASGTLWSVGNDSSAPVELRLVLDGVDTGTVALAPGEQRTITTADAGQLMEAYEGAQLVASAERSPEPCVSIRAVCADPDDGQVWELNPVRSVTVELRVGGTSVAVLDLAEFVTVQVVSQATGLGEVLIDGTVVDEAAPTSDPCVALIFTCFDSALGHVVSVANLRDDAPAAVELRVAGSTAASAEIEPLGAVELLSAAGGPAELYLDGVLAFEVELTEDPCEATLFLYSPCFDPTVRRYLWEVGNNRMVPLAVDLRLDGAPFEVLALDPFGSQTVGSATPGTMQAFVNGVLVAETPSTSDPCSESPTVAPDQLPGTGGDPGGPLVLGLACLLAGLIVFATTRRRDHRTPVRS